MQGRERRAVSSQRLGRGEGCERGGRETPERRRRAPGVKGESLTLTGPIVVLLQSLADFIVGKDVEPAELDALAAKDADRLA